MLATIKKVIRLLIPLKVILFFYNHLISLKYRNKGYLVITDRFTYKIINQNREIWLSKRHAVYLEDTIKNFDFYFDGVIPVKVSGQLVVNYTMPAWHQVKSFSEIPVFFPAVAEPVITTKQYVDFAGLKEGSVVLDLGAYSGLTSIIFSNAMNNKGRVIAVEADETNYYACEKNIGLHNKFYGGGVELLYSAVWKNCNGVEFSVEGNMGSSVIDMVGQGRAEKIKVPSVTLHQIAQQFDLSKIDFIKCDIEGAEREIFDDAAFFQKYRPKIMVECHCVAGALTATHVQKVLNKYGYTCELVDQLGYPLPLLMCTPKSK